MKAAGITTLYVMFSNFFLNGEHIAVRTVNHFDESRNAFVIGFARYMEALVAYHRYFGGKD